MNSAFAFHAVIRPATPTGSKVTVVLPQPACQWQFLERFLGREKRVDAGLHDEPGELDDAPVLLDHRGRQIVEARRSRLMQPAQDLARSSFVDRP